MPAWTWILIALLVILIVAFFVIEQGARVYTAEGASTSSASRADG